MHISGHFLGRIVDFFMVSLNPALPPSRNHPTLKVNRLLLNGKGSRTKLRSPPSADDKDGSSSLSERGDDGRVPLYFRSGEGYGRDFGDFWQSQ